MFSRMHLFNVNILFNLNKDLIFVNSVSLLHMYRLHHPRYLDKLCKKKPLRLEYLCKNMFDNIHPAGQAVLHLHRLHHSALLAVSNLIRCTMYIFCDACPPELSFTIFNKQNIQFLGPDPQQQQ